MNSSYHGRHPVYIFILLIFLGFTGWYYAEPSSSLKLAPEVLSHLPDILVNELEITQFNADGNISSHIYTPELKHFPDNNRSDFKEPRIVLYRKNQESPWFIQADRGKMQRGTHVITLMDHVILYQNADSDNRVKTITTSEITYYPENNQAETNKEIIFEQPGLHVRALGMKADLKEEKIELLNKTWVEYVQQERS